MKKFLSVAALLALTACSTVPAGHVGVKVFLLGGEKGVDHEELGVGRYWIGMNEELYLFPTFMQNYEWKEENNEALSFQTVDGMTASADVGISYSLDPSKISVIFQTYRRGIDEITDIFLRNMVRDSLVKAVSTKAIEYVYGAGKAELLKAVEKDVGEQVKELGIVSVKLSWIGQIRVPEEVRLSINAKNAATQKAQQRQNEVAQAKAEADKKIEEARGQAESILKVAEAQAKANKLVASSLTPELVQYFGLEKWDGKLPTYTGGDSVPMIQIPQQ